MKVNSETIKYFRKKHRITQAKLADILGVSHRTIQNYENGNPIPKSKLKLFYKIFEAYDTEIAVPSENELILKYKEFYASHPKFANIPLEEIIRYIIVHDEELMKNEIFQLYIKNKQSERAIEMLLAEIEKMEDKKPA